MKTNTLFLLLGWGLAAPALAQTDRAGIGTTTPRAGLDVAHDDGIVATGQGPDLLTGEPGPGNVADLPTGPGTRLLWIPQKAAFRTGQVDGTQWNPNAIGLHSTAFGFGTTASGSSSTAFGFGTTASGSGSTAFGFGTTATENGSTAFGFSTTATGSGSTAFGEQASASGTASTAFGQNTIANADYATAMGQNTTASGQASTALGISTRASGAGALASGGTASASGLYSTALGFGTTASGNQSLALGSLVSTNGKAGSFAVGDNSTGTNLLSSADNDFSARFTGGYRFFSNSATSQGLFLTPANRLRLGSGATAARAGLDVAHDDGLVATGTFGQGNTADLPTGAGVRLMWLPARGAFRAGQVSGSQWDLAQIGPYSVAMGSSTIASGENALAMGSLTLAEGRQSLALGTSASAVGDFSTAIGVNVTASARGSFAFSDASGVSLFTNGVENRFAARFAGGYGFATNNAGTIGVSLAAGGNAWSTLSDSTKKENFRQADGAVFLQKIAGMRLGSWNYKGQDARTFRHWGPMAQDFFAAFGQDGIGTIGCDTLINQADFDGVNLIAIQALVEKTDRQDADLRQLRAENAALRRLLGEVAADLRQLKAMARPMP